MAAPSAGSKPTPSGIRLDDGYQTLVSFKAAPNIGIWEKTVQPPGLDGGDMVDTTTMHNVEWRTSHPRKLRTMGGGGVSVKCAYDPYIYVTMLQLINVATTVTVFFPDGSTLAAYGWLQKFEPDALEEGKQPEATVTYHVSNQDPTTGAEEDPVFVNVAGT